MCAEEYKSRVYRQENTCLFSSNYACDCVRIDFCFFYAINRRIWASMQYFIITARIRMDQFDVAVSLLLYCYPNANDDDEKYLLYPSSSSSSSSVSVSVSDSYYSSLFKISKYKILLYILKLYSKNPNSVKNNNYDDYDDDIIEDDSNMSILDEYFKCTLYNNLEAIRFILREVSADELHFRTGSRYILYNTFPIKK